MGALAKPIAATGRSGARHDLAGSPCHRRLTTWLLGTDARPRRFLAPRYFGVPHDLRDPILASVAAPPYFGVSSTISNRHAWLSP